MIKKVSIITTTYNKNNALDNTLTGLMKQNIPFPYEICIVDDASDVSPEPIIRKHIPNNILKFKRLEKNVGPVEANTESYKLASKESDVFVTMGGDIILLDTDGIEKLCNGVGEGIFTIGEVKTLDIESNMYENWDNEVNRLKSLYNGLHTYLTVFCGSLKPDRWYIFLGAFRREEAEKARIFESWDVNYKGYLTELKYKPVFPIVKSIHQSHPSRLYKGHGTD